MLLDTLLLSRCDFLLKSNSAVSEFAIYFNPKLIDNSYDFAIVDRETPAWVASTATALEVPATAPTHAGAPKVSARPTSRSTSLRHISVGREHC